MNYDQKVVVVVPEKISFLGKHRLKQKGYTKLHDTVYEKDAPEKEFKKIKRFCDNNGFKVKFISKQTQRSNDYRDIFFAKKPVMVRNKYVCAYCGKLLCKNTVTVDHIYPVNLAQKDLSFQKKIKKWKWESINDPRNLVAACSSCNSKKSAKTGIWIVRGKIGQHLWYWYTRWFIKYTIYALAIYGVFVYFILPHFKSL